MAGQEIEVGTFDVDFLEPIRCISEEMPQRRHEYFLPHPTTPLPIFALGYAIGLRVPLPPNTAILKRYDHEYPSLAYEPHRDPDRFIGRVAMISLSNAADLTLYPRDQDPVLIRCEVGTLVICNADMLHKITPPLEEGLRHFIFYGYDVTKIAGN